MEPLSIIEKHNKWDFTLFVLCLYQNALTLFLNHSDVILGILQLYSWNHFVTCFKVRQESCSRIRIQILFFPLRFLQSNSATLSTEFSFRWVTQENTSPKVRLVQNVYVFVLVLWIIIWNTPWAPLNWRKVAMLTLCQREWHKWDRESDTESPENQTIESLSVDQFTGREKVKTERSLAL